MNYLNRIFVLHFSKQFSVCKHKIIGLWWNCLDGLFFQKKRSLYMEHGSVKTVKFSLVFCRIIIWTHWNLLWKSFSYGNLLRSTLIAASIESISQSRKWEISGKRTGSSGASPIVKSHLKVSCLTACILTWKATWLINTNWLQFLNGTVRNND